VKNVKKVNLCGTLGTQWISDWHWMSK